MKSKLTVLIYPRLGKVPGQREIQPQGADPEHNRTARTGRTGGKRVWAGGEEKLILTLDVLSLDNNGVM